jgi:propionyl-CoA synthetase
MDTRSSRYHEVYARWQRDPVAFWGEAANDIDWFEKPKTVFDAAAGIYGRWFVGGICNTCFNAVDRHVNAGRGEQAAIIYDSPLAHEKRTITYHRLLTETQVLGGMLRDLGVGKGDRVILYMPMVPEAVIAMLACARIGAIHSVVFGGFAARELATRIDDAKPKVILSASCGLEPGRIVAYKPLLDEAIALARHKPEACLILQRPQLAAAMVEGRDRDWAAMRDHALVHARNAWDCVPVAATDPLYILYTSGTTGRPKGVMRDNGGHMVALQWSMKNLDRVRHRLGGRAFLYRLCAAVSRLHVDPLRRQAGRHAGCRRLLARHHRTRRGRAVHRADGVPRDQERRPAGQAVRQVRSEKIPHAVSRR